MDFEIGNSIEKVAKASCDVYLEQENWKMQTKLTITGK